VNNTPSGSTRPSALLISREPRFIHALILLVTSGLSVLVLAILGPSLPAMQAHFSGVPNADFLVPLTMTAPMLMMAALSVFVGELADRFGRKRLLVVAAFLYAFVGTAPLYLDSLTSIIASRVCLGVMEAVLMTVSTTMIGDYYHGAQREKFMSLQTTVSAASAFLLNNLGGMVAESGWRMPYAFFAVSLLLVPLMVIFLWEPQTRAAMSDEEFAEDSLSFRPRRLVLVCALAVLTGIAFLMVPVHFGYLYGSIGVQSPAEIGLAYGLNSLGVIAGTLLFGWVLARHLKVAYQLASGAALAAFGMMLMRSADTYTALTTAGIVNGLGCGILLPTMVTWNMRELPVSRRGMGTGAFQSSLFLGMFLNPLLVVALERSEGVSRAFVTGQLGVVVMGLALVALVCGLLSVRFNAMGRRAHAHR
jgi:MFS family permease